MRFFLATLLFLATTLACGGRGPVAPFVENRGQWPGQVLYRTRVPGGALFVEQRALTFALQRGGVSDAHGHDHAAPPEPWQGHAYRVEFVEARAGTGLGLDAQGHYENYYLGSDPSHWGTHCGVFGQVRVQGLYPGIDLHFDGRQGLKYALHVAPGSDPRQIALRFTGQSGLELRDGRLVVHTTAGDVTEEAPVAFQELPGGRKTVPCRFQLDGDRVTFALPEGYDAAWPLVIDPVLGFSTYSGSSGNNFGFTATYDEGGHLYGGGIVFSSGYPTTVGALDASYNGGSIDMGITKFSPDGTSLVWSTYIGGAGSESPHSLVVNTADELYILGSSGSSDFPTTAGAYDASFNGGTTIDLNDPDGWAGLNGGYGYGHLNGSDIVVVHLAADAASLLGSTYVGGSGNDGLNNVLPLAYNYGDAFRGEIALDPQERPVVATSTSSPNIPVSPNAPQNTYGGGDQDAYLFRMDPGLTSLQATFYGGGGNDSGYGVQFDSNGQVFMSGGTNSQDLPMAGTPFHGSALGSMDGFVARFSANGGAMLSSTYIGTNSQDQCYFVQLNLANEVFVVGQTHGNYPITPGKYAVPNSTQFIQKLDHDLTTSLWSTVIGSGSGQEDISPCAFLVSDCGQIYFSGWGGNVNAHALADASSTSGLPVTADAFQEGTDGSDFYLMVLEQDASALRYATFFGGGLSLEHVDGGTSRFDKNGTVYQAVCAGCGGNDDFPSTPGAWSPQNNGEDPNGFPGCNLGVFKFNLAQVHVEVDIDGPDEVCAPANVHFVNNSSGANRFRWNFGDGPANIFAFEPDHTYTTAGTFTVTVIAEDTTGCMLSDTTTIDVHAFLPDDATVDPVDTLCPGGSVQLHAHGGTNYLWSPAQFLDDASSASPTADPPADALFTVAVTDACGTESVDVPIVVSYPHGVVAPDTIICLGGTASLWAQGGDTYAWSPPESLSASNGPSPIATPQATTAYAVEIVSDNGCIARDTVLVTVETGPPTPVTDDVAVCLGDSVRIAVSGGTSYAWTADPEIGDTTEPECWVAPLASRWFKVQVINACATVLDSVHVDVQQVITMAWPDTTVCPGDPVWLHANGGTSYTWSPSSGLNATTNADVLARPTVNTVYQVIARNALGCADTAYAQVNVFPAPSVQAIGNATIDYGDSTQLHAFGNGLLHWTPPLALNCDSCASPWVAPLTSTSYTVELTDVNGCRATASVMVYVDGTLYVPNTFTPNGDGVNDVFFALATEVRTFRLYVFDRWGQEVYTADALDKPWNGTYRSQESPIDTYVWRVDLTELSGEKRTVYGHVNLVR